MLSPFHLAVEVSNIDEAREFYGGKLGFKEGRSSDTWIDFDMFGHQFVVHLNKNKNTTPVPHSNQVDGKSVPVPHFGVVLELGDWKIFRDRCEKVIDSFAVAPYVRFEGEVGEQWTMFFLDPSGNALEFKGFKNIGESLFNK